MSRLFTKSQLVSALGHLQAKYQKRYEITLSYYTRNVTGKAFLSLILFLMFLPYDFIRRWPAAGCVYRLFNDTLRSSDYIASNDIMITVKRIWNNVQGRSNGLI